MSARLAKMQLMVRDMGSRSVGEVGGSRVSGGESEAVGS